LPCAASQVGTSGKGNATLFLLTKAVGTTKGSEYISRSWGALYEEICSRIPNGGVN
jgi:hypothetical protein